MQKIIGVDCDEVLSDTMGQILQLPFFVSKGIQRQDITNYEMWAIPIFRLSLEESTQFFWKLFNSDAFWEIQPLAGAREKLQERKSQGHKLIVVTGRPLAFKERTKQRVHQHFPDIFDDFLFSSHNTANEVPKSELCKQAGIQLVVEDNLDFVADLSQH
jgi:phosphoglycolate phosphatase-like HAD superfamily hydrolase